MSWAVSQSTGSTSSNGAGSVTYGSNVSSGTVLIIAIAVDVSTVSEPITAVKDASSNAMTKLIDKENGDGGWDSIWAIATPAGDVGTKPTWTVTNSQSANTFGVSMVALEVSGINTTKDGSGASTTGTASPCTNAAYSTSASNEFLMFTYGDNGYSTTQSTPSGWTAAAGNQQNNGNAQCSLWYKNSTGGSESASSTLSGASNWGSNILALELSAGAPAFAPHVIIPRMAIVRGSYY